MTYGHLLGPMDKWSSPLDIPSTNRRVTAICDLEATEVQLKKNLDKNLISTQRPTIGLEFIPSKGWIGGSIYLRNLVYCLASIPEVEQPEVRLLGVTDPNDPAVRTLCAFPFVIGPQPELGRIANNRLDRLWKRVRRRFLPSILSPDPESVGIQAIYPGFGPRLPGVAHIHWIPDFQHVHLPKMFTAEELAARNASMARVAGTEGILVLSSQSAQQDFSEAFPDARICSRVWRFCSVFTDNENGGANPQEKFGLPGKYLYLPNQFWKHKNHVTAFRALARLKERGIVVPLVCTGLEDDSRNPGHMEDLRNLLINLRLTDDVHMLGLVSRADQMEIFRCAAAIVQPSLFEGWSTVIEDVKVIGRPVFLSDISVHHEQMSLDPVQPFAFFPPEDDNALASLIEENWPGLSQGPDRAAEAAAADRAARFRVQAGREFLSIVNQAIEMERPGSSVRGR